VRWFIYEDNDGDPENECGVAFEINVDKDKLGKMLREGRVTERKIATLTTTAMEYMRKVVTDNQKKL